MSLHFALRRLSTTASPVSISHTKNKLRKVFDPDEALRIYSNYTYTAANDHAASTRYAQELTVRRLAKTHRFADIQTFLESHKSSPRIADESFLSSIVRSYGVAGMLENAVSTYDQMGDFGTPRTTLSFNALLYACIHCKMFGRVPGFFDEFPAKFGFEPDKFSYGILIKAYSEMGSVESAMEKVGEMEEKGIQTDAILFTTILHGLYKKGRVDEAGKFWDEMVEKKGFVPDVGSYNVRLRHIQEGKPEDVKSLIDEMGGAGLKPDTISYNYLITCYCVNGVMDEAKGVYDEMMKMKGCNPNAATFRTLIFHLCEKGRYVTAYKVFKQSVEMGKIPEFNTLKYLVEGLAKQGHMNEAKGMIRTMNKKFPPELLKAWGKLAASLGLNKAGKKEDNSGKTMSDSLETEKAST